MCGKTSQKVRNSARWKRVKQLGGAELEETVLELDDVVNKVTELGDKPFREMVSLFARVIMRVYNGRIKPLLDSLNIIGESSTLTPILVKAYLGGPLAEISTAMESIFDGVSSYDIASLMIPFLVKAYLIKRSSKGVRRGKEKRSIK